MPSTDRKLELKAKTSLAQTGSQPYVYAKGLRRIFAMCGKASPQATYTEVKI
jgi:hypothetical protein